jgi:hypothetical protein
MGVVKVIRNAWLCLVGPVQRWEWRRSIAQRSGTRDVGAVVQLVSE